MPRLSLDPDPRGPVVALPTCRMSECAVAKGVRRSRSQICKHSRIGMCKVQRNIPVECPPQKNTGGRRGQDPRDLEVQRLRFREALLLAADAPRQRKEPSIAVACGDRCREGERGGLVRRYPAGRGGPSWGHRGLCCGRFPLEVALWFRRPCRGPLWRPRSETTPNRPNTDRGGVERRHCRAGRRWISMSGAELRQHHIGQQSIAGVEVPPQTCDDCQVAAVAGSQCAHLAARTLDGWEGGRLAAGRRLQFASGPRP